MSKFIVTGGNRLRGSVKVSGSKNSTSALMFAAALGKDDVILTNIPLNSDVMTMAEILKSIGVRVHFEEQSVIINGANIVSHQPPYELVRRIRASVYTAGLLLGRLGLADVAMPGGDEIGTRPVDLHMRGFQALGAEVSIEHGQMVCKSNGLKGATYYINKVSVGATINMMLAAVLAEGTT
ncbi:MAG: UDP-N-acetylglucosamine 1-carboxyvinyltransferase, partial [Bacteroidota bacterium]